MEVVTELKWQRTRSRLSNRPSRDTLQFPGISQKLISIKVKCFKGSRNETGTIWNRPTGKNRIVLNIDMMWKGLTRNGESSSKKANFWFKRCSFFSFLSCIWERNENSAPGFAGSPTHRKELAVHQSALVTWGCHSTEANILASGPSCPGFDSKHSQIFQ